MFIQVGCISGWKYETTPLTQGRLQGISVTLRNSTVSSINPFLTTTAKASELPSVGDTARSSTNYFISDITDILIAVSVNSLDAGPFIAAQYQVPFAFTNWNNHGVASAIGKRLGVASNSILTSYPSPEQVDFQQNITGEDSVTGLIRYTAATGNILAIDEGANVQVDMDNTIVIPISAGAVAGDTAIVVVMHELPILSVEGLLLDYTASILGNLPFLDPLPRATSVSIYRKVLSASDISQGDFTFVTLGS
jgi:hypothetical protein